MKKDAQINLRLESDKIEYLRLEAEKSKMSVSSLIISIIDDIMSGNATKKDLKIEVLEAELKDLRLKFEREFGKKLPKTHRVSIAMTDEEFLRLGKVSSKMQISKSSVLRKKLLERSDVHELEVVI